MAIRGNQWPSGSVPRLRMGTCMPAHEEQRARRRDAVASNAFEFELIGTARAEQRRAELVT